MTEISGYKVLQSSWKKHLPGILKKLYASSSVKEVATVTGKLIGKSVDCRQLANLFIYINKEIPNEADQLETPGYYLGGQNKYDLEGLEKEMKKPGRTIKENDIEYDEETFALSEFIRKKGVSDIITLANNFSCSPKHIELVINKAVSQGYKIGKISDGKAYWEDAVKLPWGESRLVEIDPIKDRIKIIVISDIHIGSKYHFRAEMCDIINYGWEQGCQLGLIPGDLLDGVNVYRGQQAESLLWSIKDQTDELVNNFPKSNNKDFKWFFLSGNHDLSTFKASGYDPGETIKDKRSDFIYLGMLRARVKILDKQIELFHGGNPAYSQSYPIEKHIRATMSGTKPNVLLHGHLHYGMFMPSHRNVHCFMAGCFQGETLWTIAKNLPATCGGWIIDFGVDKKGFIKSIKPEWVSYYEGVRTVGGWQKE